MPQAALLTALRSHGDLYATHTFKQDQAFAELECALTPTGRFALV